MILTGNPLPAQEISDPEELFSEGEFFFLAEEYEEALYFYNSLLSHDPENANSQSNRATTSKRFLIFFTSMFAGS